jgi:hypothetical protein
MPYSLDCDCLSGVLKCVDNPIVSDSEPIIALPSSTQCIMGNDRSIVREADDFLEDARCYRPVKLSQVISADSVKRTEYELLTYVTHLGRKSVDTERFERALTSLARLLQGWATQRRHTA